MPPILRPTRGALGSQPPSPPLSPFGPLIHPKRPLPPHPTPSPATSAELQQTFVKATPATMAKCGQS